MAKFKDPIIARYEHEGHPYYSSARSVIVVVVVVVFVVVVVVVVVVVAHVVAHVCCH